MKIVYCIHFTHVAGGMQRVLTQKANYLAEVLRYEVVIVTTDQKKLLFSRYLPGLPNMIWR